MSFNRQQPAEACAFANNQEPAWARSLAQQLSEVQATQTQQGKVISQIMALVTVDSNKIDAVNTALQTLTTDTSTSLADIAAKLAASQNSTEDPATATELGNILSSVQALDANVKAADPGPIPVAPPANPSA